MSWSHEELDRRLHTIMQEIHDKCVRYGEVNGKINYRQGANIAGFIRVAEAMLACGNL
jgi:glutamate dehydrogenase (NADP+)